MERFWGLFDGGKFYSLRLKYRRELFDKASAIVLKADIVIDLESSDRVLPLNPSDKNTLATAKDPLKALKDKYLAGTLGELWIAGGQIHLHRKGLRFFTDTLAEHKARFESNYAMDLISGEQIALWVAEFVIGIVLNALTGLPVWVAVLTSALGTITTILLQIQKIGNEATAQALTYITYTQSVQATHAQSRLKTLGGRKALQEGALEIYQGYSNYANGFRYKNYSAGSETYQPSQPYTPSHLQTKPQESKPSQNLKQLDEHTQGRAHYDLAGNEGFMQKISPNTPLAQAKEPENDLAYRQNTLNNNSQDLRKVLSELAIYLGSTEQYSVADYLQAIYDFNFSLKEEQYHTYAQSKDFLAQSRRYNHALRANDLAYSKILAKKAAQKSKQALENPYHTLELQTPSDQENTTQPPSKIQENIIKLELESSLRAQGLDDEQVSQLVWGSESESGEQATAREQAYKQAKIKHLKALDPTKASKAIKAYDLLINYAQQLAHIEQALESSLIPTLQNLYTQAPNEVLAHRVFVEKSQAYATEIQDKALSVWVEFRMKPAFKDYFYRSTRGVSPRVILELEKERDRGYYLAYTSQWRDRRFNNQEPNQTTHPLAYELYQAQKRVWSSYDTNLWKITHKHLHDNITYFRGLECLQPLQAYLEDTSGAEVFMREIAREIKELESSL